MGLVTVLTAFVVKNIPNPWVPPKKILENNFHPFFGFQKIPPLYLRRGYFVFWRGLEILFPPPPLRTPFEKFCFDLRLPQRLIRNQ
jgi:hypothetical protein